MNLTLGTLAVLKTWLLPESERTGTDWDSAITAIGRGVALAFERHCARKLGRLEDDTFECTANRSHVVLPRYPVEVVSEIATRGVPTDSWAAQTGLIQQQNLAAGLIYFGSELGTYLERLRFTYTGGYWIDENDDGTVADTTNWQQGTAALSIGDESKAVVFPSTFAAAPAVVPIIVPPVGGMIINVVPQSITAAGFTGKIGFPIPAAGYTMQWTAQLGSTAPSSPGSLPDGATALPYDLQLAWFQQCAHVWRQKDKLGSSLASNKGEVAAMRIALDDGVVEALEPYRRRTVL